MIFRDAIPDDRQAIASLHISVSQQSYVGILPADYLAVIMPEEKARLWELRLAQGVDLAKMCLIVADDGAAVAGFACFLFDHEPEFGTYLHNLYVTPSHQGQAVARRLLVESIRRFSADCLERPVHLLTFAENHRARRFYERLSGLLVEEKQDVAARYPDVRFARYQWPTAREMSKAAWPAGA